jgi:YVTN family beta-propeller protein
MSVGTQIAGYRLEEVVGRGGMGVVYRAHDVALERSVALKLLSPTLAEDPDFRERFLVESRLAASLDHPNVVPMYDAGEVEGQLYLAMRFVEGSDLKQLLREKGPLDPSSAIAICSQIADALDAAHARGLVHRDVKPSNVLLDEREHAYLADFGLTRRLTDEAPDFDAGLSLGTPAYVAPEQIEGKDVDGRADQYSLACMLHECLTGEPPFPRGSEAATLFAHLEEPPPAPPGLEEVMRRGLAKSPDDRYGSCTEFVADARRALGLEPRRTRWPLALAGVGAAVLGAALLAFFVTRGDGAGVPEQTGRLLRIDPATSRVADIASVGDGPRAVAAGSDRVWVAGYRDASLWQVDPATGTTLKLETVGRPWEVTIHEDSAYVAASGPSAFGGNVTKYDAVTGGRLEGVELLACGIASGAVGIWLAGCPNVNELSSGGPGSGIRILETIPLPYPRDVSAANFRESLVGIATGAGSIWVLGDPSDRRLWRIDPVRKRIAATIDLGFAPRSLAVGAGSVWITDQLDDKVVRLDPQKNRVTASIPVGRGASAVAVGGGDVWVANSIDHTVSRIDPATNAVVETIDVGARPEDVTVTDDAVWVAADAS